jgi:hypothetical protein
MKKVLTVLNPLVLEPIEPDDPEANELLKVGAVPGLTVPVPTEVIAKLFALDKVPLDKPLAVLTVDTPAESVAF